MIFFFPLARFYLDALKFVIISELTDLSLSKEIFEIFKIHPEETIVSVFKT